MKRQTYTQRLNSLRKDCDTYEEQVRIAATQKRVNTKLLSEALTIGKRAQRTAQATEKRANDILRIALEVAGMKDRIGAWSIELYGPNSISEFAKLHNGSLVRFKLNMNSKKWKGAILSCPLFDIMRMQFPAAWLDMTDKELRKAMQNKL